MGYRNLRDCVADLERAGRLVRVHHEIDPHLEAAEVQRRVYRRGGPAILFTRVKGCQFQLLCNLFGTPDRMRYLFRDTIESVRKLVELKADPDRARARPWRYWDLPSLLWRMRPRIVSSGPVLAHRTSVSALPQVKCWPRDGGPFVTLPLVYTEHPDRPGWAKSNVGMYRVQLAGNEYEPDREVGLHYQIHRGIGVHHAAAIRRGERLPVTVAVGGPPALTVAAVMPLPEGLPELAFAGVLGGRRVEMVKPKPNPPAPFPEREGGERQSPSPPRGGVGEGFRSLAFPAAADFVLAGHIDPARTKPEGPFGDHLGYYSLAHPFPVMTVEAVYHRPDAIWPFTVVGRPPQEDTSFGEFIHELTGPVIPRVLPGVKGVHAVDAAGVHPLLLAIGSERYVPYSETRRPQELFTQANAILGQGQLSLAKYLFIVAQEDAPDPDVYDIPAFFRHVLERVSWADDLHFQTRTTIDTLDYSAGLGLNAGSKLVVAAAGPPRRSLGMTLPTGLRLPDGFTDPKVTLPGVLVVKGPKFDRPAEEEHEPAVRRFCREFAGDSRFPLVVIVDDSEFAAGHVNNFLWVTFTRSDPASDVHGVGEFTWQKHWGCTGPLVIDARSKPHHAPPLEEDPDVSERVDRLAAKDGPLHGVI